jgi:hypothetical protein
LNKAIPEEAVVCALPHRNYDAHYSCPSEVNILHLRAYHPAIQTPRRNEIFLSWLGAVANSACIVDSEAEVDQIGLNKAIPEEAVVCAPSQESTPTSCQ